MKPPDSVDVDLARAARLLRGAQSVVVFTGAGVSAESGIPTYRSGADGLWSAQNMERFANPAGYARNLPESYEWYRARALTALQVSPNPAHHAIAELASHVPTLTIVTQNIDSLHQRAGSTGVIELHGNLRECRCDGCGFRAPWPDAPAAPTCRACGGMLRPDVVMFNESLPEDAFAAACSAASACNVLLVIGTSLQVAPASEIPQLTLRRGGKLVVINPDMVDQPLRIDVVRIARPAGEAMPALLGLAWAGSRSDTNTSTRST